MKMYEHFRLRYSDKNDVVPVGVIGHDKKSDILVSFLSQKEAQSRKKSIYK